MSAGGRGGGGGGYKQQLLLSDGASVDFSVKYLQSIPPGNKKQNKTKTNKKTTFGEVQMKHGKKAHKRGNEHTKQVLVVVSKKEEEEKKRHPIKSISNQKHVQSQHVYCASHSLYLPTHEKFSL